MELHAQRLLAGMVQEIFHCTRIIAEPEGGEAHRAQLLTSTAIVIYSSHVESPFSATFVGENVKDLFGFEPQQFLDNPTFWTEGIHPEDVTGVLEKLPDLLKYDHHEHEYRFRCKDGTYIWVHDELKLLRDDSNKPSSIVGYWQDITAKKQAEVEIIAAKEEAEFANQMKSEFLASMSHELRTPLNAVLGFGQMLELDSENLSKSHLESISHILQGGRHLLRLINDVMDIAKIDSGSIDISMQAVSIDDALSVPLELMQPIAAQNEVTFGKPTNVGLHILADKQRFKQVLINLFSNAVKYNRVGGTVDVDVELIEDGLIRISVSDSGIGIKTEDQVSLFEPFTRISGSATMVEGTGIGLSITKKLVELMGGLIGVESEYGKGSTFWVVMPGTPAP